jgi:hypothetical protein
MQGRIEVFYIHKRGRKCVEESEDAFASSVPLNARGRFSGGGYYASAYFNEERFRLAISDGVSLKSYESKHWAELLVEHFVSRGISGLPSISRWLQTPQEEWKARVEGIAVIDDYAAVQKQNGAFATLTGVEIEGSRYRIFVVGDSHAAHARGTKVHRVFPEALERSNAAATLASVDAAYNQEIEEHLASRPENFFTEGVFTSGDTLFLMTDALSYCFLENPNVRLFKEMGAWKALFRKSFWQYREENLKKGRLADDDITLLRVSFK